MTTTNLRGGGENYRQIGTVIISETNCLSNKDLKADSYTENIQPIVLNGEPAKFNNNDALDMGKMSLTYKPAYEVHSNKFSKYGAKFIPINSLNN